MPISLKFEVYGFGAGFVILSEIEMNKTMKTNKVILTLSMLLIVVCSFGRKPPVSVQKAFKQKFPQSSHVTWTKATQTLWEAFFTINGVKSAAEFSVEGTWLETEVAIKESELPTVLHEALTTNYAGWLIADANKIESDRHGTVYVIDFNKGMMKKVLAFNEDGTLATE